MQRFIVMDLFSPNFSLSLSISSQRLFGSEIGRDVLLSNLFSSMSSFIGLVYCRINGSGRMSSVIFDFLK